MTSRKLRLAVAVTALSMAGHALAAQDYCRPKDGKDRIPKTGTCPSGSFASGDCCEAFRRDEKAAFPKAPGKACPSGTYASGGSCKSLR